MDGVARRVSSGQLVGRTDDLARGEAAIRRVLEGGSDRQAQLLLIAGEAGIGKSRLLDALLDRAREGGAVTACGRCLEHGGEIRPLIAVTEILAELGQAEQGGASTMAPAEALARLFDHARTSLRALSARCPVVVAIEDLHWSDRTTRGLLTELVRTRGLGRVLLIGTYRSDELHRRHPLLPLLADLEHAARPERIDLTPLAETEVVELAAAILDRAIGEEQGRELFRRSGGNPFYAEELLAVDDTERIPAGVRHVILARSRSLVPDALTCLQAASALASPIDPNVLEATAGLETTRHRLAVDALCRERFLVDHPDGFGFRHELVREVFIDGLLPGERAELFARAARALEQHRPERRGEIARLHVNAGQLPEALGASVRAAAAASAIGASAEASEHYGRAIDVWDRVDDAAGRAGMSHLQLLRKAAEVADLARDFDVAVELARRAIDEAVRAGDPFEEGAALLDLSGYLWNASAPGMDEAIERALAVLPREPLTVERVRLEVRSAMFREFTGERTEADRALETAADMAAQLGERGVEATARAHAGYWRALLGDDHAIRNLADGLRLARSIDDGPAGTVIAINLSHALINLGRFRETAELYDEGVAFAERHGQADTRGIVFEGNVLNALEALGRWEEAGAVMDHIGRRLSPETMHRWASAFLGWTQIQIHRGQYADVVASYHRGLEMWRTGYYGGDQLPAGSGLIELAAAGAVDPVEPGTVELWLDDLHPGQASLGARLVATAARHLIPPATSSEHGRMIETVRGWIGRIRRTAADYFEVPQVLDAWLDAAEAELAEAAGKPVPDRWAHLVAVWDEVGCRFFAATARYRQADALLRAGGGRLAGDREDATRLLEAAGRTAAELGAEPLRRDIADLTRRARLRLGDESAETAPARIASSPFALTDRELDVLRLVNDGRSNGEIGAELFISTKTASVHVSNILRKLGASNRIEAAAIARRHQLLPR
jgi:DNA-binding CsgD family transcriptional regulator/tetratricopeptide (TPR) repeat protein